MKYASIPYVQIPVSRMLFGTASGILFDATRSLHGAEPGFDQALERAFRLLDAVWAMGVNTFDCAHQYGEEPMGEWMESRGLSGKAVILSKGAHHNAWRKRVAEYDILSDCHDSLARLKRDHIDIYILHRDDPSRPVGPIVETLNRLHAEGKIGAFGASNWTHTRIAEANAYAEKHGLIPFTVSSPNYGLAEQVHDPWGGGCVGISGRDGAEARAWYQAQNMPVIAYSSLARGLFSGRVRSDDPESIAKGMDSVAQLGYLSEDNLRRLARAEELAAQKNATVPQIALAWMLHQPLNVFAVVGASTAERMESNIKATDIDLTNEECAWLNLEK